MRRGRSTQVYRHFDARGRLLYVGVSVYAVARLASHRNTSHWFGDIVRVEIEKFDTPQQALQAEAEAIRTENPLHNIMRPQDRVAPIPRPEKPAFSRDEIQAMNERNRRVLAEMKARPRKADPKRPIQTPVTLRNWRAAGCPGLE